MVTKYIKYKFKKFIKDFKDSLGLFIYLAIVIFVPLGILIALVECVSELFLLVIPLLGVYVIWKAIKDDYDEWRLNNK